MRTAAAGLLVAFALHPAGAAEPYDWILTLENGDVLHCTLEGIDGGRLVVRWEVSPDEPLRLELKAVSHLVRTGTDAAVEPREDQDMLRLHDDSVLFGRATAIGPTGVAFEVPQLGRLSIPAESILDLTRGRPQVELPDAKEGEFAVALKSGVTLAGKLVADDHGRLLLQGAGITAAIEYDSLAVLVFPAPTSAAPGEVDEQPVAGVEVRLRNGSTLGGRDPALADGRIRFKTGGVEAALPLAEVAAISFREYGLPLGRAGLRAVLAWGRWSDPGEEFRRTVDIVKAETGGRWKVSESVTAKYDDAFQRELAAVRVLLIPEMERLPPTPTDAAEIKPLLDTFLRAGGNVIVCGAQGPHLQWLSDAGLIDLAGAGQVDGAEVTFTAKGAAVGKGVAAFQAMNATHSYAIKSPDAVPLAEAQGKPVVVGRRVGRGWVFVLGADYYMTSAGASKLLGNLVQLR